MFRFSKQKVVQKEDPNVPLIHNQLEKNTTYIKQLFSYGTNQDFSSREVTARFSQKKVCLFFYSSIVDSTKIHQAIIQPLLESEGNSISSIVTIEKVKELKNFSEVVKSINSGQVVLFTEDENVAYSINVSKFEHRAVTESKNENVVKGPKEAFTESLMSNLSLIRKRIHDKQLIAEEVPVGERSELNVNVLYVKDLASDELLENVKQRLNSLHVDSIRNVESLEQYMEERPYSIIPTLLYTEKPDRAATYLEDGYIVLLMDNSSACLVLPVTFWSFFHSPEDRYLRFMFGNFTRLIRILAFFISLLTSAFYVAVTNFHSEMIPPDLLLAIVSARERVPFPGVIEVLLMELAFELIREAGLRIPNPLGPTIGIVGALILGQAAVQANVVSPIVVIIVALSGLSSFAFASISINYMVRITRFMFIFAAAFSGMFSLTGAFLLWIIYLASVQSFGVPFLSPLSPNYPSSDDTIFRRAIKKERLRPGYIKPKDLEKK